MNILLPLNKEDGVIQKANLGFQPINPAYGLSELSAKVADPGLSDDTAVIVNAGETAIPDVCAHVQYLRTKLAEPRLDMEDEAVKAWMGVLAIIALSERRTFNLTVESLDLNAGDREYLKKVYRDALANEYLLDEQNNIRVLKLNSNPIAVLDQPGKAFDGRYRCLCYPFSTIDDDGSVMYPVKWFVPGWTDKSKNKRVAHRWNNVCGLDPHNHNLSYLDGDDRIVFAEWLNALKDNPMILGTGFVDYPKAVDSIIHALGTDVVDANGQLVRVENTMNAPMMRPANLTAWRGVLACVALSKLRSCSINVEHYKPRTVRPEDDIMRYVLLRHENQSSFVLVTVNGARIGRLDENLLIRPLYCVSDPLNNVPWYFDNKWHDIEGADVSFNIMNKEERKRLANWYKELADVHPDPMVANALRDSAKMIETAFGTAAAIKGNTTPVEALISAHFPDGTMIPAQFTAIMAKISKVPDLANALPPAHEIFSDRLVLTMRGEFNGQSELGMMPNDGTKNINNEVRLKDDRDPLSIKTERHLALLPLRASFTDTFTNDPAGVDLLSLKMEQDGDDIKVTITLNNGGANVDRLWRYSISRGEVLYFAVFPYLAMWPYINADSWNEYQVAWSDKDSCYVPSYILPPAEGTLVPTHPSEMMSTFDNDVNNQWRIMQYKSFPEYVHFQTIDGGTPLDVGSIYVAPPVRHTTVGNTCYAAIDFGSSNTIVRLADTSGRIINESANQPYRVFTNNYVKPLTKCADEMDSYYNKIRDFHEFHWLPYEGMEITGTDFWKPKDKRTDKLPTVVEVYSGANLENFKAPRFGQFLHSNCNVMTYFLGEASRKGKDMKELGIRSNIKMKSDVTGTDLYDGQVAIQMILLNCALAAIEKNASLSFVVSYPDDKMWMDLNRYWVPAAVAAKETCSSINFNGKIDLKTTELWSAHYFASKYVGMVNPTVGYCIIDIGGGTTDISLWKCDSTVPGAQEQFYGGLSLKYAGNQITSETVFSFYRRLCGMANADFENFRMLWDLKKASETIQKYEAKMEEGFNDFIGMNFSVAKNVEKLHQEVPLLSTTIVSDCKFSDKVQLGFSNVQPFAALLRLKVINVFYVVAQFLNMTGAYDRNNPGTDYVFCMAGNGSAAIDACGGDITAFVCDMMKVIMQTNRSFDIQNLSKYRKTEVVNGMCSLVQEKLSAGALNGAALREPKGYVVTDSMFPKSNWSMVTPEMWEHLPQDTWNSYCQYVEYLINPAAGYVPAVEGFLSVDGSESIYSMLTMNDPVNQQLFNNNYSSIISQVVEECGSSTPLAMVPHIAAIKLIDYILLVHKYK